MLFSGYKSVFSQSLPLFKTLDHGGNEVGKVYSLSSGGYAVIGQTDQGGDDGQTY